MIDRSIIKDIMVDNMNIEKRYNELFSYYRQLCVNEDTWVIEQLVEEMIEMECNVEELHKKLGKLINE